MNRPVVLSYFRTPTSVQRPRTSAVCSMLKFARQQPAEVLDSQQRILHSFSADNECVDRGIYLISSVTRPEK